MLGFGVSDETAWSVGLPCGGEVRVLVERLGPDFADLQALRRERRPVARVIDTSSGAQALVTRDSAVGNLGLGRDLLPEARRMLAEDESGFLSLPLEAGDGGGASQAPGDAPPSIPPARGEPAFAQSAPDPAIGRNPSRMNRLPLPAGEGWGEGHRWGASALTQCSPAHSAPHPGLLPQGEGATNPRRVARRRRPECRDQDPMRAKLGGSGSSIGRPLIGLMHDKGAAPPLQPR